MREHVATELKRRSLEKDDSGSFEKVNEAEVLASMLEENAATDGTESRPRTDNEKGDDTPTTPKSEMILDDEPSKNPMVDSFLKRGHKALEDFRDWLRIIRLDAVRMNAEWVPYSAVQANVTEEEADRRANEVGIQDHGHLEASRTHHAARLVAILEAYALYDPETGYCQGMSDLLSPFVALMESDSQAFWCYVQFMKKARDNFRMDETGIRRQLQLVAKIFKVSDPQFYDHLLKIQAEDCFFVYRMIVVLLRRELTFEQTVCLWEVIWADWAALRIKSSNLLSDSNDGKRMLPASKDFLLFTIAAAVLQQRRFIIEMCRGVDEILRECNAMAGKLDIWELMDFGRELLRDYQQKVGHEKTD